MPRKCVYLSEKSIEQLPGLAEKSGHNISAYLDELIAAAADNKMEDIEGIHEELKSMRRALNIISKDLSALIEISNTYLKMFVTGETNESEFYPADEAPHPWYTKAYATVEAKIRMARYSKRR